MAQIQTSTIWDEVLDFLVGSPTLEQITEFKASEAVEMRAQYLLEQNRNGVLTPEEKDEIEKMSQLDHFVTMLKARAHKKLTEIGLNP
jgi:hypothetical protein